MEWPTDIVQQSVGQGGITPVQLSTVDSKHCRVNQRVSLFLSESGSCREAKGPGSARKSLLENSSSG